MHKAAHFQKLVSRSQHSFSFLIGQSTPEENDDDDGDLGILRNDVAAPVKAEWVLLSVYGFQLWVSSVSVVTKERN